jgi:hypothetical protein
VELLEVREGGAAGEDGDEVAVGELRWRKHPCACGGAARGLVAFEFCAFRAFRVRRVDWWAFGLQTVSANGVLGKKRPVSILKNRYHYNFISSPSKNIIFVSKYRAWYRNYRLLTLFYLHICFILCSRSC